MQKSQPKKREVSMTRPTRVVEMTANLKHPIGPLSFSQASTVRWLTQFLTGFLFGTSLSVGLGLNLIATMTIGFFTAIGVLISGSFISYLIVQFLALSLFAAASLVIFRLDPVFVIQGELFQGLYMALLSLTPFISLIKGVRSALYNIVIPSSVQLFSAILFSIAVHFLRSRMPSDSTLALSKLYFGEDNAGIVSTLSRSLELGYGSHVGEFGEFVNGAYLAASGLIQAFGVQESNTLIAALTHYNMTLLFMAWAPLAAMVTLSFSGKKFSAIYTSSLISIASAIVALLFWPFVSLGHTSVISAGLVAMVLLATTLNSHAAKEHPLFFLSLVTSLAFVMGTSWFPLMPFAAAIAAIALFGLLHLQYQKGRKGLAIGILAAFAGFFVFLAPSIFDLVLNSGSYLGMLGGTREPSYALEVVWIAVVLFTIWKLGRHVKLGSLVGTRLFIVGLATLTASNLFLLLGGLAANSGSFGYGASKYFLTSIAFSTPILWLLFANTKDKVNQRWAIGAGIALLLLLVLIQPDTRKVPATVIAPELTSWEFLSPQKLTDEQSINYRVSSTLESVLAKKPDHVFCVADYGFPVPNSDITLDSYFCSRWAQSLLADVKGAAWRLIPLDGASKEELVAIKNEFSNSKVIVIRLTRPSGSITPVLKAEETWWYEFVDSEWDVVEVN
jgi:hypothetical protein